MTVAELEALSADLEKRLSPSAKKVLEKRYLKRTEEGTPLETPADMFARVAENIAQADLLYHPELPLDGTVAEFFAVMAGLEFLPNTPTLIGLPLPLGSMISSCILFFGLLRSMSLRLTASSTDSTKFLFLDSACSFFMTSMRCWSTNAIPPM